MENTHSISKRLLYSVFLKNNSQRQRIRNLPAEATAYLLSPLKKFFLMPGLCYNSSPLFLAISNMPLENNLLISCLHHVKVKTSLSRLNLSVFPVHFWFFSLLSGLSTIFEVLWPSYTHYPRGGFIKVKAAEVLYQCLKSAGLSIKAHMGAYKLFFFISVSRGLRMEEKRAKPAFLHSRTRALCTRSTEWAGALCVSMIFVKKAANQQNAASIATKILHSPPAKGLPAAS